MDKMAPGVLYSWLSFCSGFRKRGEMLTHLNRMGVQAVGAITAGIALYIAYDMVKDCFSK